MKTIPVKGLAIVPNPELKQSILKIIHEHPDISLDFFIGDLEEALPILRAVKLEEYDVIMSRGGTARLIAQHSFLPVIEIPTTGYDILRAMKLAENTKEEIAIMGFPNITESAHLLCGFLQVRAHIFTINQKDEASAHLQTFKEKGIDTVICDTISYELARVAGLNAFLIHSGRESLQTALTNVLLIGQRFAQQKEVLQENLKALEAHTLILEGNERILFASENIPKDIPHFLSAQAKNFPENLTIIKEVGASLYAITKKETQTRQHLYTFDRINKKIKSEYTGISYLTKNEAKKRFQSVLYSKLPLPPSLPTLILIEGEQGSGQEELAAMIYCSRQENDGVLAMIDASLITDTSWNYLMTHHTSPIYAQKTALHILGLSQLSQKRQKELIHQIKTLHLQKNKLIIFSENTSKNHGLYQSLSPWIIPLPPLRQDKKQLLLLANLFLNELNTKKAKEIIGFEKEALLYLQQYPWPRNYNELRQVLELVTEPLESGYIKKADLEKIFFLNPVPPLEKDISNKWIKTMDLSQTMEALNHEIITEVVKQCKGNQSQAAKKLGISRTTLWRYLK